MDDAHHMVLNCVSMEALSARCHMALLPSALGAPLLLVCRVGRWPDQAVPHPCPAPHQLGPCSIDFVESRRGSRIPDDCSTSRRRQVRCSLCPMPLESRAHHIILIHTTAAVQSSQDHTTSTQSIPISRCIVHSGCARRSFARSVQFLFE